MGGKLHFAPLSDKIEKVVDIGTGTGVWAIEIDDFARDWTFKNNSLDFVHTRWLIGSVIDWTALFKQAYKALKPGAWLQTSQGIHFQTILDSSTTSTASQNDRSTNSSYP
ncbi:hypothetical protein ACHAPJ_011636 [Fusarium lateritium]